jgi:hypothetical protein
MNATSGLLGNSELATVGSIEHGRPLAPTEPAARSSHGLDLRSFVFICD